MDKSVLEKGPEEIILNFSYEIRLTSLTLNQNNESKKLDFEIKSFAKMFSAKSPVKNNGPYEILWRGLSRDGHIVTGTFSYYVKP